MGLGVHRRCPLAGDCRPGHAHAQALLHSPERNLLISGDQVLPKITPNVSVFGDRPNSEPLGLFLASNRRLAQSCGDVLVLPSHNRPFIGLHARIREIETHHQERLAKIEAELDSSSYDGRGRCCRSYLETASTATKSALRLAK